MNRTPLSFCDRLFGTQDQMIPEIGFDDTAQPVDLEAECRFLELGHHDTAAEVPKIAATGT